MHPRTALLATLILPASIPAAITLADALREGMVNSNQTQLLDEKLIRSREFENEQRGALWPVVSAYANAARAAQPTPTAAGIVNEPANVYSYGFQAQGPIFTFGKLSTAIQMAELQDKAVRAQVSQGKQDLQLQILDAYSAAVLARTRLGVLERGLARQTEISAMLERDFEAGKGMKAEVLVARSRLRSLVPDIAAARREADATRQNLNRLLGRSPSDTTELDTSASFRDLEADSPPSREDALRKAFESRPDLKALETSAEVYEGTSTIFRANYLPTIGYQGKLGMLAYETDQLTDWDKNQDWSIGVGLTWTLFDGFSNKAVSAQWKSDARVFRFQAADARRLVEIDVDKAIQERLSCDSSLTAAQEASAAAQEAVSLYRSNLQSGASIRLSDLLQAEESLQASELGLLSARFARTRAIARMRLAQGIDIVATPEAK